ncbi:MAG: ABC transporter permease [Desulfurococcales archaeon]|nr:ABC transporter permease [Desulfurococcales archaeon]
MTSIRNIMSAELRAQFYWLKNNKVMMFMTLVWPYLMVFIMISFGSAFGSLEEFKEKMGVASPILYLFAGSAVATASISVIDNAAGVATWHRWLGTLPYVLLVPRRFVTYLLVSSLVTSLVQVTFNLASIAPAVVVLEGASAGLRLLLVLGFMFIGTLPLLGIALLGGIASLLASEESDIINFLNPLLLLLSGVFYPVKILPWVLKQASYYIPTKYVVDAAKLAATYTHPPGSTIIIILYALVLLAVLYNMIGVFGTVYAERELRRRGVR